MLKDDMLGPAQSMVMDKVIISAKHVKLFCLCTFHEVGSDVIKSLPNNGKSTHPILQTLLGIANAGKDIICEPLTIPKKAHLQDVLLNLFKSESLVDDILSFME